MKDDDKTPTTIEQILEVVELTSATTERKLAGDLVDRTYAHLKKTLEDAEIFSQGKTPSKSQIQEKVATNPKLFKKFENILDDAVTGVKNSPIFSNETKDIMYKAIAATACLVLGTTLALGLCAAIGIASPILAAVGVLFGAAAGIAVANSMSKDKGIKFFDKSKSDTEAILVDDLEPDNSSSINHK